MAAIPSNDPTCPRWLLDLHDWVVRPYADIHQSTLLHNGYGIVTYTWGRFADFASPAKDAPDGLQWDIPSSTQWTLKHAKEVMQTIGTRYVWWDWMCVPQEVSNSKKPLTPALREAKYQEIGKQV